MLTLLGVFCLSFILVGLVTPKRPGESDDSWGNRIFGRLGYILLALFAIAIIFILYIANCYM